MKEDRNEEYMEEEDNLVTLVDEEGNRYEYEHLMTFEYRGNWYCALAQVLSPEEVSEEDEDEGEEVAIYRLEGEEDSEQLVQIEDEHELDEAFAEFSRLYEDSEDADEAAELDGEED